MARATCRILVAIGALGAASSFERIVHAGDAQEQQLAQALFDEARRLMDDKRYAEACPKLVESQRLDPGGGTLLNIAVCHEKDGKLATAKLDYDEALAAATKDRRKDRQLIARERLSAIEPLIPRMRVVVAPASDMDGLELKLDGHVLHRTAWGVSTALDPGAHVIEASAPGRTPWTTSIVLEASQKKAVDVPPLALLSQLPQTPLPPNAVEGSRAIAVHRPMVVADFGASSPVDLTSDAPEVGRRRANPVYYTALGVTVVAAATSAITGILAVSAAKDAKAGCLPDRKYCRDQESTDAADRSRTFAWVSSITLGVAAVGFVTVLIVPSRKATSSAAAVRASALPGGGTFDLSGTF